MSEASSAWVSPLLDLLFEDACIGRCLVAPDGSVLRANREWLRSTGHSLDDVLGVNIVALFPATRDMALAMHARARAGHRVEVPRHAQHIHGRETWWEGSIDPVPMEGGTGLLISAHEVPPNQGTSQNEQRLNLALESGGMGMWEWDVRADVSVWNAKEYELLGLPQGSGHEPTGRFFDTVHPDDIEGLRAGLASVLKNGSDWHRDFRIVRPGGEVRWLAGTGRVTRAASGEPLRMLGVNYDVTERKEAKETLRFHDAILGSIADAVLAIDPSFRITYFNAAAEQTYGWKAAEVIGKTAREVVRSELPEPERKSIYEKLQAGVAQRTELVQSTKDGRKIVVEGYTVPIQDDSGARSGYVVINRDVTQRRADSDRLRESEGRFRSVLDSSVDLVYRMNLRTGRCEYVSPSAEVVSGWSADEILAFDSEENLRNLHPDDVVAMREAQARLEATGKEAVEYRYRTRAGEYRWLSNHMVLVRDEQGQPIYRDGSIRDVTERLRADELLREQEKLARQRANELQVVLDAVPAAVFITRDRDATRMEANRFCAEVLRMPPGRNVSMTAPEAERPRNFRAMKDGMEVPPHELPVQIAAATGREIRDYELDLVFEGGEARQMLGNAEPLHGAEGEPCGAVGVFLDVTRLKRAEQELRAAEAQLRTVVENSRDGINMLDMKTGKYIFMSPAQVELTGFTADELRDMTAEEAYARVHPDDPDLDPAAG